jgi:signal transduction histidine kinase
MLQTEVSAAGGAPSLQFWRARILTAVVWTMAVLSTLAYATGVGAAVRVGDWAIVAFNTVAFVAVWALALLGRLPHGIRSGGVIGISYLVGLYFTARFGPFAAGPYWLFIVPLLGALLLGLRVAIGGLALVAVTLITLGVMLAQGALPWADQLEVLRWFVISGSFLSLDGLLAICIAVLLRGLATMHAEVQREAEQRAQAERMLVHSQKADAIGRLAGGVAHDFNNALTAILSFTQFVREDLSRDAQAHEDLGEVLAAAHRAQTLTQQLLAFSRQQVVEPQRVDVNEVVTTTARMLERMLGEDIELVTRLEPSPWIVFMDPSALDQVLMNLAVNARDAMPGGGHGPRHPGPHLRALFHHQGGRQGHRAGPPQLPRGGASGRRPPPRLQRAHARDDVPPLPPPSGGPGSVHPAASPAPGSQGGRDDPGGRG